jgi:aminoglycoside/choline kinase family phosphotransferase
MFLYLGADLNSKDSGFNLKEKLVNQSVRAKDQSAANEKYDANNDLHEKLIKTQVNHNNI